LCSTPSGIDEILTLPTLRPPVRLRVLNAFRHRRNHRSKSLPTWETSWSSAQRLEASTESSRGNGRRRGRNRTELNALRHSGIFASPKSPPSSKSACAQRLSASTESSRGPVCPGIPVHEALNAFRHRRKIKPDGTGTKPAQLVLNAFRHPRNH